MRRPYGCRQRRRGLVGLRHPSNRAIGQHQHAWSVSDGRKVLLDTAVRAVVTRMHTRLGRHVVGFQSYELGASRCTNFNPSFSSDRSNPGRQRWSKRTPQDSQYGYPEEVVAGSMPVHWKVCDRKNLKNYSPKIRAEAPPSPSALSVIRDIPEDIF